VLSGLRDPQQHARVTDTRSGIQFDLDDVRYVVKLENVVEIAPRVVLRPLPGLEPPLLGAVHYRGRLAVAIDLRARFGLAPRTPRLSDHFLFVQVGSRLIALVVDRVSDVLEYRASDVRPPPPECRHIAGVIESGHEVLLLEDLETVLSVEEAANFDGAAAQLERSTE
jgi:purine-binding chemotaxis protein CheW